LSATEAASPARSGLDLARRVAPLAAIALVAVAAYSNTLGAGFVFDDRPSILDHEGIRDLWEFLRTGARERPNRFVGYLSFALNYRLGGLDPSGYHAVNLAIHVVNALLVFALVRLAFRTPRLAGSAIAARSRAVAFLAAALFAAHPVQTGAVTYVVQRLTSLATTFCLAAAVQYLGWRLRAGPPRWAGPLRYALLVATVLAAMKTKEISFTLPVALVVLELACFGPLRRSRALALAPLLATMAVIPLSTLAYVSRGGGGLLEGVEQASRVQSAISRWDYATTQLPVVATYLRLLVAPVGQNLDHDFPLYTSLLAPPVLASAALIALLAAAGVVLFLRRGLDPAARLVAFGIAWFFLGLAVESSVLPITDLLMEHRVYLPSAGILVSAAAAATWLAQRASPSRGPRAVVAAGTALVLALGVATYRRNEVWADELSLWSDVVAKSPRKPRGYNSLGAALSDAGRHDDAVRTLATAIRLDPREPQPYYNLGRIYLLQGAYEPAVSLFAKALELRRDWAEPYVNLGAALNRLRRYDETIEVLGGAGEVVAGNAEAGFNLGVAYAALGRRDEAELQLRNLRRVAPPLAERLAAFMSR
jgi:Flp pilus assembly protein TadD